MRTWLSYSKATSDNLTYVQKENPVYPVLITFEFANEVGHHWTTRHVYHARDALDACEQLKRIVISHLENQEVALGGSYQALNRDEISQLAATPKIID